MVKIPDTISQPHQMSRMSKDYSCCAYDLICCMSPHTDDIRRCGWSVRLDEADLSLALSDLTSSPARSISFNRTILECKLPPSPHQSPSVLTQLPLS